MTLNFWTSCSHFLSVEMTGMCHNTQFTYAGDWIQGFVYARLAHRLWAASQIHILWCPLPPAFLSPWPCRNINQLGHWAGADRLQRREGHELGLGLRLRRAWDMLGRRCMHPNKQECWWRLGVIPLCSFLPWSHHQEASGKNRWRTV